MRKLVLPLCLFAATGATTPSREETRILQTLATLTPGDPISCVSFGRSQASLGAVGSRLVYTVSRNLVYVNQTTGGCEGVARGDALITRTPSTQLCRGDIARTVDFPVGVDTGSCAFGDFVPYTKSR